MLVLVVEDKQEDEEIYEEADAEDKSKEDVDGEDDIAVVLSFSEGRGGWMDGEWMDER